MRIDESIELILKREQVLADLFYLTFLDSYPAMQQFFVNVDMKQQNVLLTMGLFIVEQYLPVPVSGDQALSAAARAQTLPAKSSC